MDGNDIDAMYAIAVCKSTFERYARK